MKTWFRMKVFHSKIKLNHLEWKRFHFRMKIFHFRIKMSASWNHFKLKTGIIIKWNRIILEWNILILEWNRNHSKMKQNHSRMKPGKSNEMKIKAVHPYVSLFLCLKQFYFRTIILGNFEEISQNNFKGATLGRRSSLYPPGGASATP